VISPLVYIFAVAAGLVALLFAASALLTYRHARTRSERADDLRDYMVASGSLTRTMASEEVAEAHKQRARVVHVTIGDLIRDERLAVAAAEGASAAAKRRWTPVVGPGFLIDRTESGGYRVEVRRPDQPVIEVVYETEAEARAAAERLLAGFPLRREGGPEGSEPH
jgi:hypothetical protein